MEGFAPDRAGHSGSSFDSRRIMQFEWPTLSEKIFIYRSDKAAQHSENIEPASSNLRAPRPISTAADGILVPAQASN